MDEGKSKINQEDSSPFILCDRLCAYTATSTLGPFFSENSNGESITVIGGRYGEMLNKYFILLVDPMDLVEPFFQQDAMTPFQIYFERGKEQFWKKKISPPPYFLLGFGLLLFSFY